MGVDLSDGTYGRERPYDGVFLCCVLVAAIGCLCLAVLSWRPYNLAVGWMATRVEIAPRGVSSDWVASAPH